MHVCVLWLGRGSCKDLSVTLKLKIWGVWERLYIFSVSIPSHDDWNRSQRIIILVIIFILNHIILIITITLVPEDNHSNHHPYPKPYHPHHHYITCPGWPGPPAGTQPWQPAGLKSLDRTWARRRCLHSWPGHPAPDRAASRSSILNVAFLGLWHSSEARL